MTTRPSDSSGARRRTEHRLAHRIAAAGVVVYLAVVAVTVLSGTPVEGFPRFGAGAPESGRYETLLGEEVHVGGVESHDGTRFWLLARDPLLTDADTFAASVDYPRYRAQRVLYPMVAAPFRLFGERALLFGLVVVNLVAVYVGGYLTALLARELGAPPMAALAFLANPVVLIGVMYDLSEPAMIAAIVGLLLAARRGRWGWATLAAVAAVLAKEAALLPVAGAVLGLWWWRRRGDALGAGGTAPSNRVLAQLILAPTAAVGLVALFVRLRLGTGGQEVTVVNPIPFGGFAEALDGSWRVEPGGAADAFVAAVVVAVALFVALRWYRHRSLEMFASLAAVAGVPFFVAEILHRGIDSLRSIGVVLTLAVVDIAAARGTGVGGSASERARTT